MSAISFLARNYRLWWSTMRWNAHVFYYLMPPPPHLVFDISIKLSVKLSCRERPLPRRPQKPPKVELQTAQTACVYYVRGGFYPENCTGCFSGLNRVNSSSCALPAEKACAFVWACAQECASVCAWNDCLVCGPVNDGWRSSPGYCTAVTAFHKKRREEKKETSDGVNVTRNGWEQKQSEEQ